MSTSATVLSFVDFFWIWLIVAIASGGSTYLQKSDAHTDDLEEIKEQLAALTEEVRRLIGDNKPTT
jgi:hypothetical protein